MSQAKPTFRYWWTLQEWSRDKRTGAVARIAERPGGDWKWNVLHVEGNHEGLSTTQKGARAACRRIVRKLPKAT